VTKPILMWGVRNEDGTFHVVMATRKRARYWQGSHQTIVQVKVAPVKVAPARKP
jgi:hypothetical protein